MSHKSGKIIGHIFLGRLVDTEICRQKAIEESDCFLVSYNHLDRVNTIRDFEPKNERPNQRVLAVGTDLAFSGEACSTLVAKGTRKSRHS